MVVKKLTLVIVTSMTTHKLAYGSLHQDGVSYRSLYIDPVAVSGIRKLEKNGFTFKTIRLRQLFSPVSLYLSAF